MRLRTCLAESVGISLLLAVPAMGQAIFSDGFESGDLSHWTVCTGIGCYQVPCPSGTTSVSGTVFAPNGTLPLPHAWVYVPTSNVQPFSPGVACDHCATAPSGNPLVLTTTDASGAFTLTNMPATDNVPLVIQLGRWRRQITITTVPACVDTPLAADDTRLPRNSTEGDLPKIAISTGPGQAIECLMRKLGVQDSEFSVGGGAGRIQLFAGNGGTDQFDAGLGGATFSVSWSSLWSTQSQLNPYDAVIFACENAQNTGDKPPTAISALVGYVNAGGRAFLGHLQNYWIQAATDWSAVATWNNGLSPPSDLIWDVDATSPAGADFRAWLFDPQVGASTTLGKLAITTARQTATGVGTGTQRWIHLNVTSNGLPSSELLSFTAPPDQPAASRCGRVVFSDFHGAIGDSSSSSLTFPSGGCTSPVGNMTPEDKALVYMIFELTRCID